MSWRHKPVRRDTARGFILLEVLVASAVAAVLLAAVMRIFASTWSGIGTMREDADAMLVARTVIEASAPRANLAPGAQQGSTGRYAWNVVIVGPIAQTSPAVATNFTPPGVQNASSSGNSTSQANTGNQTNTGNQGDPDNPNGNANNGPPWNLFRVIVAVRAPSGRRTLLETYRLSR
jgi:Tfp pilus assembly protein PilE